MFKSGDIQWLKAKASLSGPRNRLDWTPTEGIEMVLAYEQLRDGLFTLVEAVKQVDASKLPYPNSFARSVDYARVLLQRFP